MPLVSERRGSHYPKNDCLTGRSGNQTVEHWLSCSTDRRRESIFRESFLFGSRDGGSPIGRVHGFFHFRPTGIRIHLSSPVSEGAEPEGRCLATYRSAIFK